MSFVDIRVALSNPRPAGPCGPVEGFVRPSVGFRCCKSKLYMLTTCPCFDNFQFDIFDAGGPQGHFITSVTIAIGVAKGGPTGSCPPKFILCFERRYPKQSSVIPLKSNILPPQIFCPPKFLDWLRYWPLQLGFEHFQYIRLS